MSRPTTTGTRVPTQVTRTGGPAAAPHLDETATGPIRRTLVTVHPDAHLNERGYTDFGGRFPVEHLHEADRVTSYLEDGRHAPALDIDVPAALTRSPDGSTTLWVQTAASASGWRNLLTLAHLTGLSTRGQVTDLIAPGALTPTARTAAYAAARTRTVDGTGRDSVLKAAGQTFAGSFEDALAAATASAAQVDVIGGLGLPLMPGPDLHAPWPLPLAVPAHLVASTSNQHLYVDVAVPAAEYTRLLEALQDVGVLEEAFVRISSYRHGTHLRPPWVAKPGPTGDTDPDLPF